MTKFWDTIAGLTMTIFLGAIGLGVASECTKKIGKVIYDGKINNQKVIYEEGRYLFGPNPEVPIITPLFSHRNQMVLTYGRGCNKTVYILIDEKDENNIQSLNFKNDKLERIIIKEGGWTKEDLISQDTYSNTFHEQYIKSIFEKGDNLYNTLREEIKFKIKSKHKSQLEKFPKIEKSSKRYQKN